MPSHWIGKQVSRARMVRNVTRSNGVGTALRILLLEVFGVERIVRLTIDGSTVNVRTAAPDVYVAFENLGPEFQMLRTLPFDRQDITIVDAGGYIGTAALALAKLFPGSRIICLEPSPENFAVLCTNVKGVSNIVPINAALVGVGDPGEIYLNETPTGYWGREISRSPGQGATLVKTTTFREILETNQVARIEICKMDIEGAELPLLEDPDSWLSSTDVLAIELHERKRPGIDRAFAAANRGRFCLPLRGEKMLSISHAYLARLSRA